MLYYKEMQAPVIILLLLQPHSASHIGASSDQHRGHNNIVKTESPPQGLAPPLTYALLVLVQANALSLFCIDDFKDKMRSILQEVSFVLCTSKKL